MMMFRIVTVDLCHLPWGWRQICRWNGVLAVPFEKTVAGSLTDLTQRWNYDSHLSSDRALDMACLTLGCLTLSDEAVEARGRQESCRGILP
jgi:hypothetical protein